jgi:hypothetical protein
VKPKPLSKSEQAYEFDWTLTQAWQHMGSDEKALAELDRAVGADELPYKAFEKIGERVEEGKKVDVFEEGKQLGKAHFWRAEVSLRLAESDHGPEVQAWPARACGFDPLKFKFHVPSQAVRSRYKSKVSRVTFAGAKDAGSRTQRLIRRLCNEQWPDGYDDVETRDIVSVISPKLKAMGTPIPEITLWRRALGRKE